MKFRSIAFFTALLSFSTGSFADDICKNDVATIETGYETSRADKCTIREAGLFHIESHPEFPDINSSPWYGFKIHSAKTADLEIKLSYSGSYKHRYWPKVSGDGETWRSLPESDVTISNDELSAHLTLKVQAGQTYWVSAQRPYPLSRHSEWLENFAQETHSKSQVVGTSLQGRPLSLVDTGTVGDARAAIVLVGRQHPPEVTGAVAMEAFIAQLVTHTAFLEKYRLIVVPVINPDGVVNGNWRTNMAGKDLNRDWGDFDQPETKAIADYVSENVAAEKMALMIDFHSTKRNLIYTQVDEELGERVIWLNRWFEKARAQLPDYIFTREPSAVNESQITKSYFFERYNIPGLIYEVGDNTPDDVIVRAARIFADTFVEDF